MLSLLDRRFKAQVPLGEVEKRVTDRASRDWLFDKGVLRSIGATDVAECVLGLHDGDGMVPIERESDGSYTGFCPEHGQRITFSSAQAAWVEFDGLAWANMVQGKNGLEGTASVDGSGRLFLGILKTQSRKAALVAVSAQALGLPEAYRPPGTDDLPLIFVVLGDSELGPDAREARFPVVPAADLFDPDMVTIQDEAVTRALAATPESASPGTPFLKYSDGAGTPIPMTEAEYDEAISRQSLRKLDLLIDLPRKRAWRSGKEVQCMKNKRDGGGPKKLSPNGLKLIAGYLADPRRPKRPIDVPPYNGKEDSREPLSAMVMLSNMRNALGLEEIIKTAGNPTGDPGGSLYVFESPPSFRYVLIVTAS
jgi:hypothetical protein